jgi:hypothetical protein
MLVETVHSMPAFTEPETGHCGDGKCESRCIAFVTFATFVVKHTV